MSATPALNETVYKLKSLNAHLNELETLLGKEHLLSVPTHLEIDFLSECNLRCQMCHQAKYVMPHGKLTELQLNKLIDRLPYIETAMIAGLGEPLLYKKIGDFLPFLRRYKVQSHLFTNGMLIDKHLDTLKNLNKISISFDGDNKDTFEFLRSRADFNKIVKNMEALRSTSNDLCLATSTVISSKNINEIVGIVKIALEVGLNEVHLSPVDHTPSLELKKTDIANFTAQIEQAQQLAQSTNLTIFNNIKTEHFREGRNSEISTEDTQNVSELLSGSPPTPQHTQEEDEDLDVIKVLNSNSVFVHELPADGERIELEHRYRKLKTRYKELLNVALNEPNRIKVPYCSAPWKYTFARSNGQARLCPYADIDVGKVEDVLGTDYNSLLLEKVRRSLADKRPLLAVCQNCTDDHRKFRNKETKSYLNHLIASIK